MSGAPIEALISRRSSNNPVASAEACSVYWAVVASDSPHPLGDPLAHARETERGWHKIARSDHATHSRARGPELVATFDQAASRAGDRRHGTQPSTHVRLQDAPTGPAARHRRRLETVFGRKLASLAGSCARRARGCSAWALRPGSQAAFRSIARSRPSSRPLGRAPATVPWQLFPSGPGLPEQDRRPRSVSTQSWRTERASGDDSPRSLLRLRR